MILHLNAYHGLFSSQATLQVVTDLASKPQFNKGFGDDRGSKEPTKENRHKYREAASEDFDSYLEYFENYFKCDKDLQT